MEASTSISEQLAGRLSATLITIMKSSKTEAMDVVAQFDLTLSQLRMLFVLESADSPLAMHEIAERVSLSLPAAGRAIDTLVHAGLVSRHEDTADRRVKRVSLTAAGLEATGRISESRHDAVRRYVEQMSDEKQLQLLAALDGLPAAEPSCSHTPSTSQTSLAAPAATGAAGPPTPEVPHS